MKAKQFNKLIKEHKDDLQKIINDYMLGKYYLTNKQLDQVIKLRGERKYPHYEIVKGRQVIVYE